MKIPPIGQIVASGAKLKHLPCLAPRRSGLAVRIFNRWQPLPLMRQYVTSASTRRRHIADG